MKSLISKVVIVSAIMVVIITAKVYGQDKVDLNISLGFPEFITGGLRFNRNQVQIGFNAGFIPVPEESVMTLSGNLYCHFAGSSDLTIMRPWYSMIGISYFRGQDHNQFYKLTFLNLRAGRELNITRNSVLAPDAGLCYILKYSHPDGASLFDLFAHQGMFGISFALTYIYRFKPKES